LIANSINYGVTGDIISEFPANQNLLTHTFQGKEFQDNFGYDFLTRTYDPYTMRMLQVDGANQFASGYVGMGNNPVNGVDPDGQIFIFTNLSYNLQKFFLPFAIKLNVHNGNQQLGFGFDFSYGIPKISPISHRSHFGKTVYLKQYDNSFQGVESRNGAEVSILNGLLSLSGSRFKSGETSQTLNNIKIGTTLHNIQYENDYFFDLVEKFIPNLIPSADGGDRFRTAAAELNWAGLNLGLRMFTGDRGLDNRSIENINEREHYIINEISGEDPNKYRMAAFTLGFGPIKFGTNNELNRNFFQNKLAHDKLQNPPVPYFKVLNERKNKWFFYFGFSTGNTLW
jgi:RHS repeat-associated protein